MTKFLLTDYGAHPRKDWNTVTGVQNRGAGSSVAEQLGNESATVSVLAAGDNRRKGAALAKARRLPIFT
jgi:hypothetical protein